MPAKILRLLRLTSRQQIGWRGAERQPIRRQRPGDQIAVRQVAETDRRLEAVLGKVEHGVSDDHVEINLGKQPRVVGDRRHQPLGAKRDRRRDPEATFGHGLRFQRQRFGIADQPDNLDATVIVDLPKLGEALPPRGPVQETRA
jgi:hypothetical protein